MGSECLHGSSEGTVQGLWFYEGGAVGGFKLRPSQVKASPQQEKRKRPGKRHPLLPLVVYTQAYLSGVEAGWPLLLLPPVLGLPAPAPPAAADAFACRSRLCVLCLPEGMRRACIQAALCVEVVPLAALLQRDKALCSQAVK